MVSCFVCGPCSLTVGWVVPGTLALTGVCSEAGGLNCSCVGTQQRPLHTSRPANPANSANPHLRRQCQPEQAPPAAIMLRSLRKVFPARDGNAPKVDGLLAGVGGLLNA